jgi:bacterioferritin (cytochrome b1)
MTASIQDPQAVQHLNALLRGEFSAVESYSRALEQASAQAIVALHENLESHTTRARLLSDEIRALGGTPETSAGAWGSLAGLVTGGAHLFGIDTVLAILEEGESHGLAEYRALIPQTDPQTRAVIEKVLLPAQIRSQYLVKRLYPVPAPVPPPVPVDGVAETTSGERHPVGVDAR